MRGQTGYRLDRAARLPAAARPGPAQRHGWLTHALLIAPMAILLLMGAIRNDLAGFADSQYWQAISYTPVTLFLKANAWLFYAAFCLSFLTAIVALRRLLLIPTFATALLLYLYLFGAIRTALAGSDMVGQFCFAFGALLAIQLYLSSLVYAGADMVGIIERAFVAFAIALVGLNFLEYATGNGYVPFVARFFGTASHPNFLGVQLAICTLALVSGLRARRLPALAAKGALVLAALLLLYLSGSRTGIVVTATGLFAHLFASRRLSNAVLITLGVVLVAVIFLVYGAGSDLWASGVYDRGGQDTRAAAWQLMWESVKEAPVLGHGDVPAASENSMLRGWSTLGIAYPALMVTVFCSLLISVARYAGTPSLRRVSMFVAIFAGLTAGSIFEGYLLDVFSAAIFAWVLSLAVISLWFKLQTGAQLQDLSAGAARRAPQRPMPRYRERGIRS